MMRMSRVLLPAGIAVATLIAACGGGEAAKEQEGDDKDDATPAVAVSFDPATITDAELALGDSIFHGLIGATSCQSCHGPGGVNGAAAPSLVDEKWLHSDGSFEGIHKTIASGVMTPKEFSGVMPPFGGAPLDAAKHRAVAAYVYRISHK